jgi:endo-1,4-beta-D-glucanase Y
MTTLQKIGIGLIFLAILLFAVVKVDNNPRLKVPLVFSQKELLSTLWQNYKIEYIESPSNRTLDKQQNNITTSEGESYTLLRAVWMDDQATFDSSYKWTVNILQHKSNDHLFSWRFGQIANNQYGVLTAQGGQNAATDADTDIAMALLFAHEKWNNQYYFDQAKLVIADIWKNEVVIVQGKPVITANDVEHNSPNRLIVNPSYFAPYAYRMFALVDPTHDWKGAIDNAYTILAQSASLKLDKNQSAGLVPDWIAIDRTTGAISAVGNGTLTTNYSYDALRTPWRLALDWQWYQEPRAKSLLDSLGFFKTQWHANNALSTVYGHDGSLNQISESPAMYGGSIGYFTVSDSADAANVYKQKLQILYNPDTNAWKKTLSYYDDNWAWFGIALYNNLLPNLGATITRQ